MQGGNRPVVEVGGRGPDAVERRGLVADALGVDGVAFAEPRGVVMLDGSVREAQRPRWAVRGRSPV